MPSYHKPGLPAYVRTARVSSPCILYIIAVGVLLLIMAPLYSLYSLTLETERQNLLNQSIHRIYQTLNIESQPLCSKYFEKLFEIDPNWSYHAVTSYDILAPDRLKDIQMENSVTNLRIFSKCFLGENVDLTHGANYEPAPGSTTLNYESMQRFATLESRLVPYFNHKTFPTYANVVGDAFEKISRTSPFFWKNIHDLMSGKGIVIGANDLTIHHVIRLLKVLTSLENTLPIEVVYTKLSLYSRGALASLGMDLLMVDVSPALLSTPLPLSLLGSLFSTFEDMVYIDASSVPLIAPSELFETKEYTELGALFFKDHKAFNNHLPCFLKHLLPNYIEQKLVGSKRLGVPFTKDKLNFGLFAMKRSTHFVGLLINSALHHWNGELGNELLWLGQALSGDSAMLNYYVHKFHAGLIGQIKSDTNMKSISSSQKAFFDDNRKLIWVEGGFVSCDDLNPDLLHIDGGFIPSEYPYKEIIEDKNGCEKPLYTALAFDDSRYHKLKQYNRFIHYDQAQINQIELVVTTWLDLD